jgi:hypothetical protein
MGMSPAPQPQPTTLLLDLKDVYWARQGRISVDLGVGLVAAGGTTFSAIPLLRRLHANRRRRD